jgi:hypothetical protein
MVVRRTARRAIQRDGLGACGPRELRDKSCLSPRSDLLRSHVRLAPRVTQLGARLTRRRRTLCYFRNLVSSNASFRLSISQAVRAIRAARIEIALALPCCFSKRAT